MTGKLVVTRVVIFIRKSRKGLVISKRVARYFRYIVYWYMTLL